MTRNQNYTIVVRINSNNLKGSWINPHLAMTVDMCRMAKRLDVTPVERTTTLGIEETMFTCTSYNTAAIFWKGVQSLARQNRLVRRVTLRGGHGGTKLVVR